jgi:hypothetical protein
MPASAGVLTDTQVEQAELGTLAAEMAARGYTARLHTPHARLPYLEIRNPEVSALSEKVYAQAGAFWFSWAAKIADTDSPADAARMLARVLATADVRSQSQA